MERNNILTSLLEFQEECSVVLSTVQRLSKIRTKMCPLAWVVVKLLVALARAVSVKSEARL